MRKPIPALTVALLPCAVLLWLSAHAQTNPNDIPEGQEWLIQGSPSAGHLVAEKPGFENAGTIRLQSAGGGYVSGLRITDGRLTNAVLGKFISAVGSGGPRHLQGAVINQGLVQVDLTLRLDGGGGVFANRGTVAVAENQSLLLLNNQTFRQEAGALQTTGWVDGTGGQFIFDGGTVGERVYLQNSTLQLNPGSEGSGVFYLAGSVSVLQNGTQAGQTVVVRGDGRGGHAVVTAPGDTTSAGRLIFDSVSGGYTSTFELAGTLQNLGTMEANPGAGGARNWHFSLVNAGTVNINQGTSLNRAGGVHANEGLLNVAAGHTLTLPANTQLFRQAGGSMNIQGGFTLVNGTFEFVGGSIGGYPYLINSLLRIGEQATGVGQFISTGPSSRFEGKIHSGQEVWIRGDNGGSHTVMTAAEGFLSEGKIRVESVHGGYHTHLTINGLLTNRGKVEINPGTGGSRNVSFDLLNEGEVAINTGVSFPRTSGNYRNRGTFRVAPGHTVTINDAGQSFFQEAGLLDIDGGFTLIGGRFVYSGGQIENGPYLVNSSLESLPSAVAPALFYVTGSGSRLLSGINPNTTVWLRGDNSGSHTTVIAPNGLSNRGVVRLESVHGGYATHLTVQNGLLVNESSGQLIVAGGTGGPRNITAAIKNDGKVEILYGTSLFGDGATYENFGDFYIAPSVPLNFASPNQVFAQNNGRLRVAGGFTLPGGIFQMNGGDIEGTPYLVNTALQIAPSGRGRAYWIGTGNGSLVTGKIYDGQTLWIRGDNSGGHTVIPVTDGFVNEGLIRIESVHGGYVSGISTEGTFVNAGQLNFVTGTGGPRRLIGNVINRGRLTTEAGADFTAAGKTIWNEGEMILSGVVNVHGAGQKFVQAGGNLRIPDGGYLYVNTGEFEMAGGEVNGLVYMVGAQLTFAETGVGAGRWILTGGAVPLRGSISEGQNVWIRGDNNGGHTTVNWQSGWNNAGLLEIHSVNGGYAIALNSANTITNRHGGTIRFLTGTGGPRTLTANILNEGSFEVQTPVSANKADGSFVNAGVMDLPANITFTLTGNYSQRAGNSRVNGRLVAGGPIGLTGGALSGNGEVAASVVNEGAVVAPGSSAGRLRIAGNYEQKTGGTLEIELGGGVVATQYDQLQVTGGSTLGGTLRVRLINGYVPASGAAFTVVSSASLSSRFGGYDLPTLPDGLRWKVNYSGGNVELRVLEDGPATTRIFGKITENGGDAVAGVNVTAAVEEMSFAGLRGEYYHNADFTSLAFLRLDPQVEFDWGGGSPRADVDGNSFSVRWTGTVTARYSETYTFYTISDDGIRLWINDQLIINNWGDHAPTENSGQIAMQAGVPVSLKLEYYENGGGAVARMHWSSPSQPREAISGGQLSPSSTEGLTPASMEIFVETTTSDTNGDYSIPVYAATWKVGLHGLAELGFDPVETRTVEVGSSEAREDFQVLPFSGESYQMVLSAAPENAGTVAGGGHFAAGAVVTVTATPNVSVQPWQFRSWTENGLFQSANAQYTFPATRDRMLQANFVLPTYQITAANQPAGAGTVTGGGNYLHDQQVTLRAHPAFGYRFDRWLAGEEVVGTEATLTFVAKGNRTVTAVYAEANLSHRVTTATAPAGLGTVAGAGTYGNGETATIVAPQAITNGTTLYSFNRFLMNGSAAGTSATLTKTFATTDPVEVVFVAEYSSRSLLPLVVRTDVNPRSPVKAISNFTIAVQFDRTMKTDVIPLITISNKVSGASLAVNREGTWVRRASDNDTFLAIPITIPPGSDGQYLIWVAEGTSGEGTVMEPVAVTEFTVDTTAPLASELAVEAEMMALRFAWQLSENAAVRVHYGFNPTPDTISPEQPAQSAGQLRIANLLPGTTYYYRLALRDAAGNETLTDIRTVATLPDTVRPTISQTAGPSNGAPLCELPGRFAWRGQDVGTPEGNLAFSMRLDGGDWSPFSAATEINLESLSDGPHVLEVRVKDVAGNESEQPLRAAFVFDRAAPVITQITVAAQAGTALIHWSTDERSTSQVEFGLTPELGTVLPIDGRFTTAHAYELRGLTPDTVYYYLVRSTDLCAKTTSSTAGNFRTKAAPDLEVRNLEIVPAGGVQSGMELAVRWSEANTGAAAAVGEWIDLVVVSNLTTAVKLLETPVRFSSEAQGAIQAGGTAVRQALIKLPEGPAAVGELQILVALDQFNSVLEANTGGTAEQNNQASINTTATIAPYPDLVVEGVTMLPEPLQSSASATIGWKVRNIGNAAAGKGFKSLLTVRNLSTGETLLRTTLEESATIAGGGELLKQQVLRLPDGLRGAGNLLVEIKVDSGNELFEHSAGIDAEANNTISQRFTSGLASYPDLVVLNVIGPVTASASEEISVSWSIRNEGAASLNGNWLTQLYLSPGGNTDGVLLGVVSQTASISAGELRAFTERVRIPAFGSGERFLVVRVDAGNRIFETNENNNQASGAGAVNIGASLALSATHGSVVESGGAVQVTVTRNSDTSGPLQIGLSSAPAGLLAAPSQVTIPAGARAVSFNVSAVNDALVNGTRSVNLAATSAGFGSGELPLSVEDEDTPTLLLEVNRSSILENAGPSAISALLTRNTPASAALVVSVSSSDQDRLAVPPAVIIPAGEASARFTVAAINNAFPNTEARITINASVAGYSSLPVAVTIVDDDIPSLALSLSAGEVSEGAANPATVLTVTRTPAGESMAVLLSSSDRLQASLPLVGRFAAGQSTITLPVEVEDNAIVDGQREVALTAYPTDTLLETALGEGIGEIRLVILDDDGPVLKLEAMTELVAEGSTTQVRVSRNTSTAAALLVSLASSDAGQAGVQTTVTIPAGQVSALATVTGIRDGIVDGAKDVTITASAEGFTKGLATVTVSDRDLPDLVPSAIVVPEVGLSGGNAEVSWHVDNQGIATAESPWIDRIYISAVESPTEKELVAELLRAGNLEVSLGYDRSATIKLPADPGNYIVTLITDESDRVEEGVEKNNSIRSRAIAVAPGYRAEVTTDATQVLNGTPVVFRGRAFNTINNAPMPLVEVMVRILVKGSRRAMLVRTDASGNFETTFQPLPYEGGRVSIGADHPGVFQDTIQDQFDIIGMRVQETGLDFRLFPNAAPEGEITIQNLGGSALTGLRGDLEFFQGGITIDIPVPASIAANEAIRVPYRLTVPDLRETADLRARVKFSSSEGAVAYLPVRVFVDQHVPRLVANPGALQSGMLRGAKTLVEFRVSNTGGAASGPVRVILPQVTWMSLVTPETMPSLEPGAEAKVMIALNPPADLPLERYDGQIGVGSDSTGLRVSYQFRAISEAKGDLRVEVLDPYTFHAVGAPKLADAEVILTDGFSGAVVARGTTDSTGYVTLTGLMEGTYQMRITAEKHNDFRSPVTIVPGILNEITGFLDRQTVTYRWTVVPAEIEDHYKVVLESVFETEVPIPVVTIAEPMIMPLMVEGEETEVDVEVTNHGLIAAELVHFEFPIHPLWEFEALSEVIDTLPAKTTMTIPLKVKAKPGVQFAGLPGTRQSASGKKSQFDCEPLPEIKVKWSFVCGPDRRWHANPIEVVPVPVKHDCWKEIKKNFDKNIKELEKKGKKPKDLLKWNKLCDLGVLLGNCLDSECLITITKMVCGVATRDVKGAVMAALRFGNCWCPDITLPTYTSKIDPPRIISDCIGCGWGGPGGGSGPGGCTWCIIDPPIWPRIDWEFSPDCRPGDTKSGEHKFSLHHVGHPATAEPATQSGGVCARVRLRIEQEAVISRAVFIGTLELENGHPAQLTDIQLTLDIRDDEQNNANDLFGVRAPELSGITAVDGTGTIAANGTGTAKFTFIPTRDAAPDEPTVYFIGGTLRYKEGTNVVEVPLLPDQVTVLPDPLLHLVYFQQRDVYADDPFTDVIEPSEPFALGLLVKNLGKGVARDFRITSAQPEIIENEKGLLIDFKIISSQVGNESRTPSLTLNLGEIQPASAKVGTWFLTSTLQGKFIEYTATFEHIDGLGDPRLSLIDSVEIHELIHPVMADRAIDDQVLDFLVNDTPDPENLPDRVYFSQNGSSAPVEVISGVTSDGQARLGDLEVQVNGPAFAGFGYIKLPDPGAGLRLWKVTRSDGKQIRLNENAWTTDRSFPSQLAGARRENLLHIFDHESTGRYIVTYRVIDSTVPELVRLMHPNPPAQPGTSIIAEFSEQMDLSTLTAEDLVVTRDGIELSLPVLTVRAVTDTTVAITGFGDLTTQDGNYELTLNGAGVQDYGGNAAQGTATIRWVRGTVAPVILDLAAMPPVITASPVSVVDLVLSKPINLQTVDNSQLSLTRNGGPNLLVFGTQFLDLGGARYRLLGLGPVTLESGQYELRLNGAAFADAEGVRGKGSLITRWEVDTTGPQLASVEEIATNPRNIIVQSVSLHFNEAIDPATFGVSDLALTRDGIEVQLAPESELRRLSATEWQLVNFARFAGQEGLYELRVNAAGVRDPAGNQGSGSLATEWTMDTSRPGQPTEPRVVPDSGKSDRDGLVNTTELVLMGQLPENGLTVRLRDTTTGTDLGQARVIDRGFSKVLDLGSPGPHRLQVMLVDLAGNTFESHLDVYVDLAPATAVWQSIAPNTTNPVPSIDITFSEEINTATLSLADFALTRGTSGNLLTTQQLLFVGGNTYRITGLNDLTSADDSYRLTVNMAGIQDLAGNAGESPVVLSWRKTIGNIAPELAPISNRTIGAGSLLMLTANATDEDVPAQRLTYSLVDPPAGATINSTNGVFRWRPTRDQSGRAHTITVRVRDSGSPTLADNEEFVVTVQDFLEVSGGQLVVRTETRASVPLRIVSSGQLTSLMFMLTMPPDRLQQVTIEPALAEIGTLDYWDEQPGVFLVTITAKPGMSITGDQTLAHVHFRSAGSRSSFVPVEISALSGRVADGGAVPVVTSRPGRVAIIVGEPLLEMLPGSGAARLLLYGIVGRNYQLQSGNTLNIFDPRESVQMLQLIQELSVLPSAPMQFYRAKETP